MPELAVEGFGTALGSFGSASVTSVPGDSRYWPRTHHGLAGVQTFLNERDALERLAHRDGTYRYLVILTDHEDDQTLRPLLDGVQRNRQAIVLGRCHQPHVDECAGPKLALLIGKHRFELDRAGAGIGLIVYHKKAAGIELGLVVLAEGDGLQRSLRHSALNLRYVRRGESENHADRLNLGHHDQGVRRS